MQKKLKDINVRYLLFLQSYSFFQIHWITKYIKLLKSQSVTLNDFIYGSNFIDIYDYIDLLWVNFKVDWVL